MSRKHFQTLADSIRNILDPHVRLNAAVAVAGACAKMNPKFNADRFYAACGIA